MRILEILEREGEGQALFTHTLCYVGMNAAGKISFNGLERDLYLLPPGEKKFLPPDSAGFVLSVREFPSDFFFSVDESLFRVSPSTSPFPLLRLEKGGFVTLSMKSIFLRPLTAGILTVSDKGSRGEREDFSGPALAERVRGIGADVLYTGLVPDEHDAIIPLLEQWSDGKRINLILCTGGTGFSRRDVTPEALEMVAEKRIPGIGEAMRSASMAVTSKAMLSRSNAVLRGETLIISVPGSAKAAVECFDAIAPALRHGIEILCGWDSECGTTLKE